jgi:hypothetical protein
MMNARTRRELMDEMFQEYDMQLVKSLMATISEQTGKSCSEAADIVISAWRRSKDPSVESNCLDHDHDHENHVTATASYN